MNGIVPSVPRKGTVRRKLFVVEGCKTCPNMKTERTQGAGCADDWMCEAFTPRRVITGYIEYPSEEPKAGVFPDWCPLKDAP